MPCTLFWLSLYYELLCPGLCCGLSSASLSSQFFEHSPASTFSMFNFFLLWWLGTYTFNGFFITLYYSFFLLSLDSALYAFTFNLPQFPKTPYDLHIPTCLNQCSPRVKLFYFSLSSGYLRFCLWLSSILSPHTLGWSHHDQLHSLLYVDDTQLIFLSLFNPGSSYCLIFLPRKSIFSRLKASYFSPQSLPSF